MVGGSLDALLFVVAKYIHFGLSTEGIRYG